MKKALLAALTCATLAHVGFWGTRYFKAPKAERNWLIFLGPGQGMVRCLARRLLSHR